MVKQGWIQGAEGVRPSVVSSPPIPIAKATDDDWWYHSTPMGPVPYGGHPGYQGGTGEGAQFPASPESNLPNPRELPPEEARILKELERANMPWPTDAPWVQSADWPKDLKPSEWARVLQKRARDDPEFRTSLASFRSAKEAQEDAADFYKDWEFWTKAALSTVGTVYPAVAPATSALTSAIQAYEEIEAAQNAEQILKATQKAWQSLASPLAYLGVPYSQEMINLGNLAYDVAVPAVSGDWGALAEEVSGSEDIGAVISFLTKSKKPAKKAKRKKKKAHETFQLVWV